MKKRLITLGVALVLMAGVLMVGGQASGLFDFSFQKKNTVTISQAEYDRLKRYSQMDEIMQYIEAWYLEEPDTAMLMEYATRGMMAALGDPYTFYYNAEEWADLQEEIAGEYGGVGMQLLGNVETNLVTVTRVFRDAPAERAGIRKGDILVRVEDIEVNAFTMQDAVDVMRGTLNEEVEIEVKRGDEYLTFRMNRAIVTINQVEYTMLEGDVGYILLYQFENNCAKEVKAALAELENQGAQSLILDLRDNPGGYVQEAIDIADLFLDKELLMYSEDRYGDKDEYFTKEGKHSIPLLILVNGNSASSSEILAGGLHDNGRATLMGTQSFGKGIIQTVIPLNGNTEGFQMTYAQYFLPSGSPVHKIGITPDIISEMPEELASEMFELGDLNDPQLKEAVEYAKGMTAVKD
ncbi:MAG: S41 family peptidase [Clostridia bacterium]|nr:S41 family peptidase [Clostridia bacterium]